MEVATHAVIRRLRIRYTVDFIHSGDGWETAFAPQGRLDFGTEGTLEGGRGPKIKAASLSRDAVLSIQSHLVKVNSLRWLSLTLLPSVRSAARVWALPVLAKLAPSKRYNRAHQALESSP